MELRHGCDLVREAYVGSTGTAADRRDPLYNAALRRGEELPRALTQRQRARAEYQTGLPAATGSGARRARRRP